jgi:hypothetical protein
MTRKQTLAFGAFAIATAAMALGAGALVDGARTAPSAATSANTERSIPMKIGDRYYLIPANVLASPPEGGKEGSFHVDDGAYLEFSWPDMGGRTKDNGKDIEGLRVLTFAMRDLDSSLTLAGLFVAHVLEPTPRRVECENPLTPDRCSYLYEGGRFTHLDDVNGMLHFEREDRNPSDPQFRSDIYLERASDDMTAFSVCNRPSEMRRGTGCTTRFTFKDQWYAVSFNTKAFSVTDWERVRDAVKRRMDEFELDGEAFRSTTRVSE